jgi:hypothetical protein
MQLDCYVMAVERITGKKVSGKYIYLFYNGDIIAY